MSLKVAIVQQHDQSLNVTLMNDDGVQRQFKLDKEVGAPMYVVCGQPYDYMRNGVKHAHYLGFTYDLFVYDGKHLRKIGASVP